MAHQDQVDPRSATRGPPAATHPANPTDEGPAGGAATTGPGTTGPGTTGAPATTSSGAPVVPEQRGSSQTAAELVVSRGPDTGVRYPVGQPAISIGRRRESDIVLDDPTVSRTHAELAVREGGFVITDSGSLNGTYVNRKPVDVGELADGDEVWIGKVRFIFQISR